jgi:hypothetical protein
MPYERPGAGHYTTATKAVTHGQLTVEDNIVGVAIKQKAAGWAAGLAAQNAIGIGESFHIRTQGIRQVAFVASAVKGSTVWIHVTTNAVTLTDPGSGNGRKVGRVREIQGQRGCPTGFMRVDLDDKDSF